MVFPNTSSGLHPNKRSAAGFHTLILSSRSEPTTAMGAALTSARNCSLPRRAAACRAVTTNSTMSSAAISKTTAVPAEAAAVTYQGCRNHHIRKANRQVGYDIRPKQPLIAHVALPVGKKIRRQEKTRTKPKTCRPQEKTAECEPCLSLGQRSLRLRNRWGGGGHPRLPFSRVEAGLPEAHAPFDSVGKGEIRSRTVERRNARLGDTKHCTPGGIHEELRECGCPANPTPPFAQ